MEGIRRERRQVPELHRGQGKRETQRSSQAEEERKHMQVERERRSVQREGEAEAHCSPKEAPADCQGRGARDAGKARPRERHPEPPEGDRMSPNGEKKPSGKTLRYLEVRFKAGDYRHSCKKQLYHLVSCFVRFLSGNLSSEGCGSGAKRAATLLKNSPSWVDLDRCPDEGGTPV
ncbi:hypothetical protein JRQ81_011180 [Phrynocephalus forsythii]|uniref:Uncharacterized protein n=1 Tax=Phrynocephalus forsythii TaxID=171643 RepID=A0A9Q0X861_9SAUR|nr:hypothetical protein JRQ81_011180 [Phrynocephalus forsythii]